MSTTLAAGYGVPGSPVLVSPGERLCHGGSAAAGSRGSVGAQERETLVVVTL